MQRKINARFIGGFILKGLFFMCLFGSAALFADESCSACHKDIQSSCNLSCTDCHLSSKAAGQIQPADHPRIIANPSKEEYWREKCVPCHAKEIERFQNSLHYSLAGIIGQTRFLWGKSATPFAENTPTAWKELKRVTLHGAHTTAELVDGLLAQKCMACHFESAGRNQAAGRKRAAGCASCHIPLDQKTGIPLFGHKMQSQVSDTTCLTCHSGNRVGADYYGYFEHDYHNDYQTPYGASPQFGSFQHRLVPDLHQRAGMRCVDCHSQGHGMGGKTGPAFEGQKSTIICQDCHGGFVKKVKKKNTEKVIPLFDKGIIAHRDFHQKVSCASCHAGWSYQDYGLHLFFDQSNHYEQWSDYRWQDDAEITALLDKQLIRPVEQRTTARMSNKLTGDPLAGAWYKGWTFRRWEGVILGRDMNGQYAPIRPLYQYYVSYVDSAETVWLDSKIPKRSDGKPGWSWDVYTPHTIQRKGRSCESCHENTLAAGLGIRSAQKDSVAHIITLPSAPVLPGTRLLNSDEQKRLLNSSAAYKKWRAKEMRRHGLLKLLH